MTSKEVDNVRVISEESEKVAEETKTSPILEQEGNEQITSGGVSGEKVDCKPHKVKDISQPTSMSVVAMENIERSYVEVMRLLASEPQLETFKNEYEKLHRLLRKSYDGERKLLQKTQELQQELYSHRAKMETALQLSSEDETVVAKLRKEIEQAWAMADTAHAREQESREMVLVLKRQVAELDALVEKNAHLSLGQEVYLREILNTKKSREDENTLLKVKLSTLTNEHHLRKMKLDKAQSTTREVRNLLDAKLNEYRELLLNIENEAKERISVEETVKEHRSTLESWLKKLAQRKNEANVFLNDERQLKSEANVQQNYLEQVIEQLSEKQRLFNVEADRLSAVEEQNTSLRNEGPKKESDLAAKKKELSKVMRECRNITEKTKNQQMEIETCVTERNQLVEENNTLTIEIDELLTSIAQEEKQSQAVEKEIQRAMGAKTTTLSKNAAAETSRTDMEGKYTLEMNKRRRLQQTLEPLLKENEQLRKNVFQLKQSQQKENNRVESVMMLYHRLLDQIRSKSELNCQLKNKLWHENDKYKTQQELLDKVKTDRTRLEKEFNESSMDLSMLQDKHRVRVNNLNQVKDDIVEQETRLCQLYNVNVQLEKDAMHSKKRVEHLISDADAMSSREKLLSDEISQLHRVVAKCDAEKTQHSLRLHNLIDERNVLASQLLRKSDELTLLIDKTDLQDKSLSSGAEAYTLIIDHLQKIRKDVVGYRLQCKLSLLRAAYVSRLSRKELHGDRMLREIRSKVKALSESLEGQVNIHRWRHLQGNSPELYNNLIKVQLLQHRLISANDECRSKKIKVAEAEKEYEELRRELARLPGPEAVEQLALFHENISKRSTQINEMHQELTNVETEAEVLEDEMQELMMKLSWMKKEYYEAKYKHETLLRQRAAMQQTWSMAPHFIQQIFSEWNEKETTTMPHSTLEVEKQRQMNLHISSCRERAQHTSSATLAIEPFSMRTAPKELALSETEKISSSTVKRQLEREHQLNNEQHRYYEEEEYEQQQQEQQHSQQRYLRNHSKRLAPQLYKLSSSHSLEQHRRWQPEKQLSLPLPRASSPASSSSLSLALSKLEHKTVGQELLTETACEGETEMCKLAQLSQHKRVNKKNSHHNKPSFHELFNQEDHMIQMFTTGISASNYPLQLTAPSTSRKSQRVFVGGGFALTR